MIFISKEELLDALEKKYGELDDECGCSIYTNKGFEWLSIKNIVDIIHDCDIYDDED